MYDMFFSHSNLNMFIPYSDLFVKSFYEELLGVRVGLEKLFCRDSYIYLSGGGGGIH